MTAEERRAYIRRIVDAAPPLSAEDADLVRAVLPLSARYGARRLAQRSPQPAPSRAAAA